MRSAAFVIGVLAFASVACESKTATAPSNHSAVSIVGLAVRPQPPEPFSARIQHHAVLTDAGGVQVTAHLSCPAGHSVLEALVTLAQRDGQVWGQGGFASVACDGTSRGYTALVHPVEGQFRRGAANASGYILVCDTAGRCPSLNFSRRVVLKE